MRSTLDFEAWTRIAYGRLSAGQCVSYGQNCTVEASVGIATAHRVAPDDVDLELPHVRGDHGESELNELVKGQGVMTAAERWGAALLWDS